MVENGAAEYGKPKRIKLTPRQRVIIKYKWLREKDPALQAEVAEVRFSLDAIAQELRETYFRELDFTPQVFFAMTKCLAYVVTEPQGGRVPYIVINPLYNHPDTPEEVIRSTLKHEFIHFFIGPRVVEKRTTFHPPEFWEREREICPEMRRCDMYTEMNFCDGLFRVPEDEFHEGALLVKPRYIRKRRAKPRVAFEKCVEMVEWEKDFFAKYGGRPAG